MKRTYIPIICFTFMLALSAACGVQADTVPIPDGSVSDVPQQPLSEEQEQETDSAALSALRQQTSAAGCRCAVANPDYETDETSFPALRDALCEAYPVLENAVCVDVGGEEYYVIVPADPAADIAVYRCDLDDAGDLRAEAAPLENASNGTVILLRCNVSDIVPNTLVRITDSSGDIFEFHPFLSLKDGHIRIDGVYDFTAYPDYPATE